MSGWLEMKRLLNYYEKQTCLLLPGGPTGKATLGKTTIYFRVVFSGFFFKLFISCIFLLAGCRQSPPEEVETDKPNPLNTSVEHLTARQTISVYDRPQGIQIAQLKTGEKPVLTPSISEKLYTHFTKQDTLCLPYLQIQLSQHQSGWILAKADHFEGLDADWQFSQCMRAVLNDQDFKNYEHLIDTWENAQKAPLLLLAFETEHQLIRKLEEALLPYTYLNSSTFEGLLPATIAYKNNESISWWVDYNQWVERSLQTEERYDDALMKFYQKKIFPPDGISYGFPAWTFPVSANLDHSLLGRGIHYSYLQELNELRTNHPQINYKWDKITELVISDILRPNRSFWEELPAIEQELTSIIELNVPIIQQQYKGDLQALLLRLRNSGSEQIGFRGR